MSYKLVSEFKDVENFKYCPYCGAKDDYLGIQDGDFTAHTLCLNCDYSIGFYVLEEVRNRFPNSWKDRVFS